LEPEASKRLLTRILKEARWKYVISSSYVKDPKVPQTYEAFVFLDGCFFYFSRSERLLTAGWKSKENVSQLSYFRLVGKNAEQLLSNSADDRTIPIHTLVPGSSDKLGTLTPNPEPTVYLNKSLYEDIERDVIKTVTEEKGKLGILLHGSPGNGKTQFVKYLAVKYSLPVYVMYLQPDYSNHDIALMFSEIPNKCIVLLEDFDTMFDGRNCTMKNDNVRFTFDVLINAFDGIHNDYRGVVFMVSANDIGKIDDSLKKRPSRFKYVREFTKPDAEVRMKILQDENSVRETDDMTLDQVFLFQNQRCNSDTAQVTLWPHPGGFVAQ